MKAAWMALGLVVILAALVWVEHTISRLADDSRDSTESLLDAVLDHPKAGVWVTPNDDLAMWDEEMQDHLGGAS